MAPSHPRPEHHRSHSAHARAQQRLYVPAGTPMAVEIGEGMLERAVMSRPVSPDSDSRSSSRSPRSRSPRSRSSAERARSRPVGTSLSPHPSRSRSKNDLERRVSDTGYLADRDGGGSPGTEGGGGWDTPLDGGSRPENPRTASSDDWDNIRDGSIARRPAWRRPSTRWVIPFLISTTFSLGLTMSPRTELLLNVVCLVHPPSMPSNAVVAESAGLGDFTPAPQLALVPGAYAHLPVGGPLYDPNSLAYVTETELNSIQLEPSPGIITAPGKPAPITPREPLSPGAKWFLDAQRAIAARLGRGSPTNPIPDGGNSSTPQPYPEIDPSLCKKDPEVASNAAQLTKILTMTAGLLAALTTGFWAGISDRIGRRKVLAVVALGLMLNDACFLFFTSHPILLVKSQMYVLLAGPILDGLLGGLSTVTATLHAYISDVTPAGSRATAFAQVGGALMFGLMTGPFISSLVVGYTDSIIFPFYISILMHGLTAILFRFLLPESLSTESRIQLTKKAKLAAERRREREQEQVYWEQMGPRRLAAHQSSLSPLRSSPSPSTSPGDSGWSRVRAAGLSRVEQVRAASNRYRTVRRFLGSLRRTARRMVWFLEPLTILIPEKDSSGKRDYNLTVVALMLFLGSCIMGVMQIKMLYAMKALGWGSTENGFYMSFVSLCRGLVLLGLMPAAMYWAKPRFTAASVAEPVNASGASGEGASGSADGTNGTSGSSSTTNGASFQSNGASGTSTSTAVASETTPLLSGNSKDTRSATAASATPSSKSQPSHGTSSSFNTSKPAQSSDTSTSPSAQTQPKRSLSLDLTITRLCLLVEILGFLILGLNAHNSSTIYVASSAFLTLGSPGNAACNSLALGFLRNQREAGTLFGALAVLSALGSALLSPMIAANVFSATVRYYAPAIFLCAAGILLLSLAASLLLRIDRAGIDEEMGGRGRETSRSRSRNRRSRSRSKRRRERF